LASKPIEARGFDDAPRMASCRSVLLATVVQAAQEDFAARVLDVG
jgi:hypothetical protein